MSDSVPRKKEILDSLRNRWIAKYGPNAEEVIEAEMQSIGFKKFMTTKVNDST